MSENLAQILEQIRTTNPMSIYMRALIKELIKELNELKQNEHE